MAVIGVPTLLGPILGPGHRRPDRRQLLLALDLLRQRAGGHRRAGAGRAHPAARREPTGRGAVLDVRGLLLLSPGLAFLVFGLSEVGMQGSFTDWRVLVGVVVGLVLLVLFVLHALRGRRALAARPRAVPRPRVRGRLGHDVHLRRVAVRGDADPAALLPGRPRRDARWRRACCWRRRASGAAMAMPIAGRLTDRLGAGKIVPFGRGRRGARDRASTRSSRPTRPTGCSASRCGCAGSGSA